MYEIHSKYNNSRVIDYNRWSEAPEVDAAVSFLVDDMKAKGLANKVDGYRHNMKTLLMELYHSYLSDEEQYLGFHRGHSHYDFKIRLGDSPNKNRYTKNPHITYAYFTGSIEYLAKEGFLETKIGGHFTDAKGDSYGYLSRMKPTEKLVTLWDHYGFQPEMISRFQSEEVIILKAPVRRETYGYKTRRRTRKVKDLIPDYPDTRDVIAKRKVVESYNDLLEKTHIDCDLECMLQDDRSAILDRLMLMKDQYTYSVNLSRKRVYRVFNNNSFKEGGRFYGAWWIGCPSILRKYITINGEPTVELDYSNMHIHLLYALKKINFAELKTDAYELVSNDPYRKLNKLILLTAFNADSPMSAAKAVFNDCRLDGTLRHYNLQNKDQILERLTLLTQKHKAIKGYIAKDFGSKLQYKDSSVLEQVISHFTELKVPILTVHDSVICQRKYKRIVMNKMLECYCDQINRSYRMAIKPRPLIPDASLMIRYMLDKFDPVVEPVSRLAQAMFGHNSDKYTYKGRLPDIKKDIIEVTEEITQFKCSGACKQTGRWTTVQTGKRIFLGKIHVSYEVTEGVATLKIRG